VVHGRGADERLLHVRGEGGIHEPCARACGRGLHRAVAGVQVERSRLLYTGKYAGLEYAQGYEFNPETNSPCNPDSDAEGCQALSDDFLQYYLGAFLYNEDAGTTSRGTLYDVIGTDNPFNSLEWSFGSPGANNQDHSASFITTSGPGRVRGQAGRDLDRVRERLVRAGARRVRR
jgi:hypothetical protein